MTPALVLATIKSVADATTEALKFAQTAAGQRWIDEILADHQLWDKRLAEIGAGLKRFFSGELFK